MRRTPTRSRSADADSDAAVRADADADSSTPIEARARTPVPVPAAGRERRRDRRPLPPVLLACLILLLVAMTAGVAIGSVALTPGAVWQVAADHLSGQPRQSVADAIVWQIRLPRVLPAAVVGAALTTAGTVVQALVRNSLADPFLLGVSSGASVGAAAVLLLGAFASIGVWAVSVGSVIGAVAATVAVFLVSGAGRRHSPTQLILCGVALSALFESVTSFLIFRGNPQATQSILFWLLGSFGNASWPHLPIPATVAVAGVIGFVGLAVPHIVRLPVGSDHRRALPVGVLFGAAFMVIGELLARTIVCPQEMSIGVITAFIGAPTLIVLIRRRPYLYGAPQ